MKIAIFTDTFTPQVNGVARTFQRFVDYLDENKIEYRLFVPATEDDPFSSQILRFTSYPFFLYPECRITFPNVFHIKKELEEFQPDLIHVATPFNMGLTGIYYSKKLNIPLVGSYHTNFDRYLQYYDLQILSNWITKYMKWFHRSFRKIFVPSNDTKNQLLNQGYSNIHIWSRGVDCSKFHHRVSSARLREKYNINAPYLLSYVGRLAPEKDIDVLMEVARKLPEDIKEKVHWLLVGDGPLLEEMKMQKRNNMTLTGYLSGDQLTEVYAISDLFVFPSSTETFGNVVLEAHACGTAAIGARAGGVQEIIHHKETGILCEKGNVDEFVQNISHLIKHPTLLKLMGWEARKYALGRSWDAIFNDLILQYEHVLKEDKKVIENKLVNY